jgi:hypothetical protein
MENKSYFKIVYSNEKKFGYFFSLVFLLISLYPLLFGSSLKIWSLTLSVILLFISFKFSKILIIPNKIWNNLGFLLNKIVSPVIMFLIFIITFFPIGLIFKILQIDLLNKKIDVKTKSYWINRKNKLESLKKLF